MCFVFRVDASTQIGIGHVMRCLTMAKALKNKGHTCIFICRSHEGHLGRLIELNGMVCHLLVGIPEKLNSDMNLNWNRHASWLKATKEDDAEETIEILKKYDVTWLVVDHYALDKSWEKAVLNVVRKLMVIDDLGDREHLCDVLLDQNYGSNQKKYLGLVPKHCEIMAGTDFALLQKDFAHWREYSLKRRKAESFKKILVAMGGVDAGNHTSQILKILKSSYQTFGIQGITVVMGENSPHLEEVKELIPQMLVKTALLIGISNMAEVMAKADIGIGASGATTWERCCLGLPAIQMTVAENQKEVSNKLASTGAIKLIDDVKALNVAIKEIKKHLFNISIKASGLVDGLGVNRVMDMLEEGSVSEGEMQLIPYQSLSHNESIEVLSMRNHPEVRRWMYRKESIEISEHLKFVRSLLETTDSRYLYVKKDNLPIGAINFTEINYDRCDAEFGVFANLQDKLKGNGELLVSEAIKYARVFLRIKKLKLSVYSENQRAIKLYSRLGFIKSGKELSNDVFTVLMEKNL